MSSESAPAPDPDVPYYLPLEHIKILPWREAQDVRTSLSFEPNLVTETYASTKVYSQRARAKVYRLFESQLLALKRESDLVAAEWMVQELIINAFKDGNKMDPMRWVTLTYGIRNTAFVLFIKDEGAGFHPYRVDNPQRADWIGSEDHGRGMICVDSFTGKLQGSTKYLPIAPGMDPHDAHTRCSELIVDIPMDAESAKMIQQFRREFAAFEMSPPSIDENAPVDDI